MKQIIYYEDATKTNEKGRYFIYSKSSLDILDAIDSTHINCFSVIGITKGNEVIKKIFYAK